MTDEPKTTVTPSLPMTLPEFEGEIPTGVVTRVNGSGQRITRAIHRREKVVLVVEATVDEVNHKGTKDGLHRVQVANVEDLYELEGKAGSVLLRSLRQAYKLADDHRAGRKVLPGELEQPEAGEGIEVTVDGNGTVLTDVERAAARGEVLPGLPHVDVAVLVFEDGSRALWPDDFADATGPHPEAGERIAKPGAKAKDNPVLIRQVLDADTGETVEEWTEAQEDERLAELEAEALAEEARQDVEATNELELARERHNMADRLLYAEGKKRSIGSVSGNLEAITDPKVVEIALGLERKDGDRAGMIAALEGRLAELEKEAAE